MLKNLYPDSLEASGRYLRIILKELSELKLPYTPIAYSVWYEYASGRNPELHKEIEAARKKKDLINYQTILEWFKHYVSDRPLVVAKEQTRKAENLLNGMTSCLNEAGNRMGRQRDNLKARIEDLNNASNQSDIKNICRDIILETQRIIDGNTEVKKNVHKTISELDALTLELKKLREAAKTDMLTGLLNRRGFEDAMVKPIKEAQAKTTPLTLIIADLDRFKRINDNYGHITGDNVLKLLSRLLQKHIKGKDIAGRFGGEEFIMALPETKMDGGFALAEQIRTSLEKMKWQSKSSGKDIGTITISLGVAQFIPDENLNSLIARADKALYSAKEKGRNRTAIHNGKEVIFP
ncbi:GGDEF domain-containing protein [Desulfobacter latus]|uniref:diguanylate cyclase n=1 Tax=Desulfobacter latus TaxID=2292 RepID=A0A850T9A9_9BACT|nr:GGDEF domain-containing protein [Desulfobacter latus]NWH03946.1 GGDEF domain-containing protein [Desulfobacter latus]